MGKDLSTELEGASRALHKLPAFGEQVFRFAATSTGIILFAMVLVWLAFKVLSVNWMPLIELLERRRKQRFTVLDAYVKEPTHPDGTALEVIRDIRDAAYFEAAVGIYAEHAARSALSKLHQVSPTVITWRRIGRASDYISTESGIATIAISRSATLGYWFNAALGWLFMAFGFAAMLLLAFGALLGGKLALGALAMGIGLFVFGVFVLSQNLGMRTARLISEELQRQQEEASKAHTANGEHAKVSREAAVPMPSDAPAAVSVRSRQPSGLGRWRKPMQIGDRASRVLYRYWELSK